jgi:hypothetical protein
MLCYSKYLLIMDWLGLIVLSHILVSIYVINVIIRLYIILQTNIQTFDVTELNFSQ